MWVRDAYVSVLKDEVLYSMRSYYMIVLLTKEPEMIENSLRISGCIPLLDLRLLCLSGTRQKHHLGFVGRPLAPPHDTRTRQDTGRITR